MKYTNASADHFLHTFLQTDQKVNIMKDNWNVRVVGSKVLVENKSKVERCSSRKYKIQKIENISFVLSFQCENTSKSV